MKRVEAETYVRILNAVDPDYRYELSPYTLGEFKCCIVQISMCDSTARVERLGRVGAKLRLTALASYHSQMTDHCFTVLSQYS